MCLIENQNCLKLTLPAAIISNFSGIDLKPSMLVVTLLGFAGGILYIAVAFHEYRKRTGRTGIQYTEFARMQYR